MIRVLQVFTVMNRGGSESMIMNYYRNIDRSKVQFDFLVHRQEKGIFDDEIESLGGSIYRLNPISPFFSKKYDNELRIFFKQHSEYKIVHAHLNTFSCFPLKIAQEFGIPVRIAHAHTASPKVKLQDFFNKRDAIEALKILVKLQLRKRIHTYTTHCFSCGEKAGKWLYGEKSNFKTINNAIDAANFSYNEAVANTYKQENNLTEQLVVGHIGNFTEPKNHSFILDVFNEVLQLHTKSRLVLIGDGPLKPEIVAKANELNITDQVLFLGVRTDIPNLCKMLDVFVFPSFYEGLPVTLVEAQAADLKIFASDTITNEVKITDKLEFLSINASPKLWAKKIVENYPYQRTDTKQMVEKNGYDIKQNAIELEEFYVHQSL